MVYRKLQMDVAAFRRFVAEQGERYPGGPELLAAKIVGRWPDGTPLERSPDRPDPALAADPAAHQRLLLRATTPTACAARSARTSAAPTRATRRASSAAGSPTATASSAAAAPTARRCRRASLEDDGVDRGLVFVCFNASIWRQFETIQALWIDDGDPFGLGADKDFLIGEPHGTAAAR